MIKAIFRPLTKWPGANPKTAAEWQEAVNAAEFMLLLDSAERYGLIEGGPKPDVERCIRILHRGRALGYTPLPHSRLCELFLTPEKQP